VASRKLGEILIELGLIDEAGLKRALEVQSREGGTLGRAVSGLGLANEQQVSHALADWFRLECLSRPEAVSSVATLLPADFCRKRLVAPMGLENRTLRLAMADPLDIAAIQDVEFRTGLTVVPVVAGESIVTAVIDRLYPPTDRTDDILNLASDASETVEVEAVRDEDDPALSDDVSVDSEQPETVRLVNAVLANGAKEGASDIHLEPHERGIQVRFRIDGMLQNALQIPRSLQDATISRLKLMSGMDISERRKPQDGRSQLNTGGRRIDMRVSTVPTQYGEKIVIRLLDSAKAQIAMEDLGLTADNMNRMQRLLTQPTGMILVTGPTGSGKTSTLYASLNWLKSPTKNILTIEDPIEYRLPGISQVQINLKAGMTFASALRSFLRQDPNVILVGEIRDTETAAIALEASQTGHLLLSTLHTNDAAATITRLIDLGTEPFLVASSVVGILAQRLVRRVCPGCAAEAPPSDLTVQRLGGSDRLPQDVAWKAGRGCSACHDLGFKGRVAVHELLEVTPEVRELITQKAPDHAIREAAQRGGMLTLVQDGITKAAAGLTTLEEVLRVAPAIDTQRAGRRETAAVVAVAPPTPSAASSNGTSTAGVGDTDTVKRRILVVEDSKTVLEVVKYYLELEGFDVLVAADGEAGIEVARREHPDAIVSDVEMPRMDGRALVRALREDASTKGLPVMLLTSLTDVDAETEGLNAGADDYVSKPVEPRRLAARVRALLARGRRRGEDN
jgi:type II secretory ATPase GspE/PulE/Tfp pilus assembly ATPase PilB-like protein/ActR/RegA family two-component response regulator